MYYVFFQIIEGEVTSLLESENEDYEEHKGHLSEIVKSQMKVTYIVIIIPPPLPKHIYSNILKILLPQNEKFLDKISVTFSYFCSKRSLWVPIRTASHGMFS